VIETPSGPSTTEAGPAFKVIVNQSSGVARATRRELSDMFLKRVDRWPAGDPVMPIDQSERAPVRLAFTKDVHKRSLGEIKTYWQQKVFAGSGTPPMVRASDLEVVDYVKDHRGAVGYVSAETRLEPGVRLLQVTE